VLARFGWLLHIASAVISLIAVASFALFAINQTGTASAHEQKVLSGEAQAPSIAGEPNANGEAMPAGATTRPPSSRPASTRPQHKSTLRTRIDEASNELSKPFSSVLPSSSGEWSLRVMKLLLALAVYGFGLSFLARILRVRV
jgi:hypothetical protein